MNTKDVKKNYRMIGILIITIVISIFFIVWLNRTMEKKYEFTVPEGYTIVYSSVQIKSGDTLDSITTNLLKQDAPLASVNDKRQLMNEITKINNIDPDHIHSGSYIIVPLTMIEDAE